MKYLLSSGLSTNKVELYIIDLFKLYLQVYPNDVPGYSSLGFNFILTGTKKAELSSEVRRRLDDLVGKIKSQFSQNITIELSSIEIVDEKLIKVTIDVNNRESEEIVINIAEE